MIHSNWPHCGIKHCVSECPGPFENYKNNCFYLSTVQVDWREAELLCYGDGGELIQVKTREKQLDMMNYLDSEFSCGSTG